MCFEWPRPSSERETGVRVDPLASVLAREVEFDHHIVVVGEEQLVDRRLGDVVLAVFDALFLEGRLDPGEIAREKREMVEGAGVVGGSAADCIGPRHQMDDRHIAAIKPVAREIEVGAEAFAQPENVAVEIARRLQIAGLHGDVVQCVERHGSSSLEWTKLKASSETIISLKATTPSAQPISRQRQPLRLP